MRVLALSDPHLAHATPGKEMDRFGEHWVRHPERIAAAWRETVREQDVVLVPGDISWAMRLEQARPDLEFLAALPGTKILLKGNHDYWWQSVGKVRAVLPERMFALQADALRVGDVAFAGTRLWDVPEVRFGDLIDWQPNADGSISAERTLDDEEQSRKVFRRELGRLRRALAQLDRGPPTRDAPCKIVLTHYPPCGPDLEPTEVTELFESHDLRHSVFGHLHAVRRDRVPAPFGEKRGIGYHLTSCDYVDFRPVLIEEVG